MEIKISRINTNALYTLSEFRINGSHFAFVLESTPNMLPKSKYIVRLSKHSCRKQNIYLYTKAPEGSKHPYQPTKVAIVLGNSWKEAERSHNIIIGTPLIPGVMYKGQPLYEQLIDRITKCSERKEPITLKITNHHMRYMHAISHWLS